MPMPCLTGPGFEGIHTISSKRIGLNYTGKEAFSFGCSSSLISTSTLFICIGKKKKITVGFLHGKWSSYFTFNSWYLQGGLAAPLCKEPKGRSGSHIKKEWLRNVHHPMQVNHGLALAIGIIFSLSGQKNKVLYSMSHRPSTAIQFTFHSGTRGYKLGGKGEFAYVRLSWCS